MKPLHSWNIDGSIDCVGGKNKNLPTCKFKEEVDSFPLYKLMENSMHRWNIHSQMEHSSHAHCRRAIKFQSSFINRTMCKWIRTIYCSMPVWHIDWSHAFSFQLVVNSSNMESPFSFIATRSRWRIFINQKKVIQINGMPYFDVEQKECTSKASRTENTIQSNFKSQRYFGFFKSFQTKQKELKV